MNTQPMRTPWQRRANWHKCARAGVQGVIAGVVIGGAVIAAKLFGLF